MVAQFRHAGLDPASIAMHLGKWTGLCPGDFDAGREMDCGLRRNDDDGTALTGVVG